jgi:hypothetical protein
MGFTKEGGTHTEAVLNWIASAQSFSISAQDDTALSRV